MKSNPFRKEALENLSSPEKLTEVMRAVSLKNWILLLVLAILLFSALIWGIFGHLPFQVSGTGILVKGDGIVEIESLTAGEIIQVDVRPGQHVEVGERLGIMKVPYTENQLELAKSSLKEAEQNHQLLMNSYQSLYTEKSQSFDEKEATLKRRLAQSQSQLKRLADIVATKDQLRQQGILTEEALIIPQKDLAEEQETHRMLENDWDQLAIDREQARQELIHNKTQNEAELTRARLLFNQLNTQQAFEERLESHQNGIVTEVKARPGSIVEAHTPLFSIEPHEHDLPLELILYIPAREGKRVKAGMSVYISPSTAKREEYGYLKGRVSFVSLYPASKAAMLHHIHNESLVHTLTSDEPVLQVTARLLPNPHTHTGYAWTNKKGPSYPIESGTLCQANVVIETHRPLHYLLPFTKQHLGF